MKNFRKVLALVLVVATLFSFAAMTSAKTYEDADKISYEMAVDVLSAVGILNGYEDDTFKPTNTISREEMAKMIAVLANSGYDVSELFASANTFADVEATRWSASYIAYCANAGIVAGRSAETFDPYGKVTGLETAKMLLVTLGFDAAEQGYVGANWKVNVLADAKIMGLLDGFAADYDVDAAITREEAANMMLNALRAPAVVGVLSDNIIKVTNALVFGTDAADDTNLSSLVTVASYATLKDALKAGSWSLYGNVVISDDVLYTKLFKGLELDLDGDECFGRPAVAFTYTVKGIVKASGNYFVGGGKAYTTQVDLATDYKAELAAKEKGAPYYTVKVVMDGLEIPQADNDAAVKYVLNKTGNGIDTVVYIDGKDIVVNIINVYIGKVSDINKYTKTFDIDAEADTAVADNFANDIAIVDAVKEGDFVLFRVCKAATHAKIYGAANGSCDWGSVCVHDYEVVTGKDVTISYTEDWTGSKHPNSCKFKTTDGDVYFYNRNYNTIYTQTGTELKQSEKKTVYTDKYGYVMLITKQAKAAEKVAYFVESAMTLEEIKGAWISGDNYKTTKVNHFTKVAGFTGAAVESIELGAEKANVTAGDGQLVGTYKARYDAEKVGTLMTYTVDADGYASMGEYLGNFANHEVTKVIGPTTKNLVVKGETNAWLLTDETSFMIRTKDAKTGAYNYAEVIGVANLPYTYGVKKDAVQALDLKGDNKADYVFIDATVVSNACEFILLNAEPNFHATWDGVAKIDNGEYDVYRALVGGVESLVAVKKGSVMTEQVYTSALSYVGVALAENDNLPLYESVSGPKAVGNVALQNLAIDVTNGKVSVNIKEAINGVIYGWVDAIAELPVYYLVAADEDLNNLSGVWTETNGLTKQLYADAGADAFVIFNGDDVVSAIYVITSTWDK